MRAAIAAMSCAVESHSRTPGERWEEGGKLLGIQMKAGQCDLMLSQDDFAKGRDRAKGDGVRLWLSTAQDIAAIAARITASGVKLDYEPREMPWGDYAFAITDPDGYKITVIQEEEAASAARRPRTA